MMASECRRCIECQGVEHHWLDELIFDPRLSPTADPVGDAVCKHCPAVGKSCEKCGGDGEMYGEDGDGRDTVAPCSACNGRGVNVVPGVVVVEDEDGTPVVKAEATGIASAGDDSSCPACHGTGDCLDCEGTGRSEDNHDAEGNCMACDGTGICGVCDDEDIVVEGQVVG